MESTEPKQVYVVKLEFVSERTIKDHHHQQDILFVFVLLLLVGDVSCGAAAAGREVAGAGPGRCPQQAVW